jgi:hypothetical protein
MLPWYQQIVQVVVMTIVMVRLIMRRMALPA